MLRGELLSGGRAAPDAGGEPASISPLPTATPRPCHHKCTKATFPRPLGGSALTGLKSI